MRIRLELNGAPRSFDVAVETNLLRLLREQAHLRGTKNGCEEGGCGACSVLVDGELVYACLVPAAAIDGARVETVEGVAAREHDDASAPTAACGLVPQAFLDAGAVQCGYCTPGMVMATVALLRRTPRPTRPEILDGLGGNLCRCTGYLQIVEAVETAASRAAGEGRR